MQRIRPKDANLSTMASSFAHEAKYSHRKALKRIAAAQSPRNEMQRKYTKMCVNDIHTNTHSYMPCAHANAHRTDQTRKKLRNEIRIAQ